MAQRVQKHAHKFRRFAYKTGAKYFQCILPDCYFKISCELTLGKRNICNTCGNEFEMNSYSIRAERPKCMECVKRKSLSFKKEKINAVKPAEIVISAADNLRERLVKTIDRQLSEEDTGEI